MNAANRALWLRLLRVVRRLALALVNRPERVVRQKVKVPVYLLPIKPKPRAKTPAQLEEEAEIARGRALFADLESESLRQLDAARKRAGVTRVVTQGRSQRKPKPRPRNGRNASTVTQAWGKRR